MKNSTQNKEKMKQTKTKTTPKSHVKGWTDKIHYMALNGQCGQSCPCCRAHAFKVGADPDGWFGACQICLKNTFTKGYNKKKCGKK